MTQFIGYSLDDYWPHGGNKPVPVSTGATYEEAMVSAVARVLSMGITDGGVSVREMDDPLSDSVWTQLKTLLDGWFAAKGIIQ